jgi:2-iminobutanoate/2-iminopropanoate deaminase
MAPLRSTVTALGAPAAVGPYSHGVVHGGLLFCSGQVHVDPETNALVGDTVGDRATRCLENLAAVCAAAGAQVADAVRVTVYVTDISTFADVNEAYAKFFAADPPARVTIGVAALPLGATIEMDAIVALPDNA